MSTLQIQLFGSLRIHYAGSPITAVNTNRLHSVMAWLILCGGTPQPRERLASILWPDSSGSQARTNLRQLLHHLKRALPAECPSLRGDHFTVQWMRDGNCSVDAIQFQDALTSAAHAKDQTKNQAKDREAEIRYLTEAARLYEDDLLPGLYDDWLTPLREDYRKQLTTALTRLTSLLEEQGQFAAAIPHAERLTGHDPLCETNYQLLIRLNAANQDRASALRAYHQCMTVLRRELGVQPGPATIALFERVLKSDRTSPEQQAKTPRPLRTARTLVGRTAERQRLEWAWQSVAAEGPRAVIISGEPGIGKTHLAEELLRGNRAARSRCYSGQGQVPYAPIAEWMRSDAIGAAWPKLDQLQPSSESWSRLQLYQLLNETFAKSAKPLLLFIDDLQWCDPDSLEWLQSFLVSPAALGAMVLGTVREEETGRSHPFTRFLAGLRQAGFVLEIPLAPLDAQETTELARQESPEPLELGKLGEIFQSTKGNPLFVLESVRAGLQGTRVHAVIAARLAQLSAASYELAGLGSVVGRPFSFELLEKASDWDERSLSTALDELWQRRIIESRGPAEYDFTHDRLREVTYAELSLVRLRYLHRRVARALADVHENHLENWHGQIAAHYEQASMAEDAVEQYRLAANYARERYAYTESADLLRRGLALCRQFPESAKWLERELELLVTLGPALVTTEGYSAPEVGATYERALKISRSLGDRNLVLILTGSWAFHVVRGNLEKAREYGLEFLRAAGTAPAPGMALAGNLILGSSLFHLGRLEESLQHMEAGMRAHSGPDESVLALFAGPDVGVFCRSYMAHLSWHRAIDNGDSHSSAAVQMADRMRHPFSQAIALDYAALLHAFRGEASAALLRGRQAMELCGRHAFAYYLAMAKVLTGWAMGQEGLAQLREGMEGMRALGAELRLPYYYALLAETYGKAGLLGEAMASLSTGFAFLTKNGEDWAAPELHRVQGDLLAGKGQSEPALLSYTRGLEAARRCGSLAFERKLQNLLARTAERHSTERS